MGYEITFHYKENEESKVKTINVGTPNEEISLELVAGKVFAQLARRNILVTDVEINEFTKKAVRYKEVDDGIIIKNKKFKFDDGIMTSCSSPDPTEAEEEANRIIELIKNHPALSQVAKNIAKPTQPTEVPVSQDEEYIETEAPVLRPTPPAPAPKPVAKTPNPFGKVLRQEVYSPPDEFLREAKRRGLKFTVGKTYPIYKEKTIGENEDILVYTTINDANERQNISAIHFLPITKGFDGRGNNEAQLSWPGLVNGGAISLR